MSWDPVWEQVFRSQSWGRYPSESLVRFVARNFGNVPDRSGVRILEVGCGPGGNLWYLAREGFCAYGIDGSATAIDQAQQRLDADVPGWHGDLRVADATRLPFPDAFFDAVVDSEAVSCNAFEASQAIYDEMARVTKPGGKFYSRTFASGTVGEGTGESAGHNAWLCDTGPLAGKGLARFTTREEIPELIRNFAIEEIETLSWTVGNGASELREWVVCGRRDGSR